MSRLGSVIGFLRSYKYYIVIFASVVLVGFAD
ncbi:MAG TPA: septum formation initiator family protein, partial [Xylanibacter oryzae]|nr:septum formation initiator family protein [Xylanibacter oryzae]